jgi:hypothetical protein
MHKAYFKEGLIKYVSRKERQVVKCFLFAFNNNALRSWRLGERILINQGHVNKNYLVCQAYGHFILITAGESAGTSEW